MILLKKNLESSELQNHTRLRSKRSGCLSLLCFVSKAHLFIHCNSVQIHKVVKGIKESYTTHTGNKSLCSFSQLSLCHFFKLPCAFTATCHRYFFLSGWCFRQIAPFKPQPQLITEDIKQLHTQCQLKQSHRVKCHQ